MGEVKTNPYKTLIGQLLGWLHQLPVIGFNWGTYDLNVIKQFFVPYLLKPSKQEDHDEEVEMEAAKTNPYKTLIGQLLGWLHQLPVIGLTRESMI